MEPITILENIHKILQGLSILPKDSPPPNEDTMLDEMGLDSLDKVETIMALEEEYDIVIHDHEVEKVNTVGDMVAIVRAKIDDKNNNNA